jgi:hypothetical protein
MSSFIVTGKLGSGKTLVSVGRIFDYLRQGRKVATNLDIYLEKYLLPESKRTLIRLPDKPTGDDMLALGSGNETPDEEKNGLLVLDELGSWFNSRNWQDKSRQKLLDWFIHARKHGWDTMLIVQDIDMIDNQLRGMLAEHLVICKRMDRIKIPYIGGLLRQFGLKGNLPKVHSARVFYGDTESALPVDRWTYLGRDFYPAYDTKQIFSPTYSNGIYTLLSPWLTVGRYLPAKLSFKEKAIHLWNAYLNPPKPVLLDLKPKHPLVAKIMKLPESKRLEFFRRFEECGAFARSSFS